MIKFTVDTLNCDSIVLRPHYANILFKRGFLYLCKVARAGMHGPEFNVNGCVMDYMQCEYVAGLLASKNPACCCCC